ncbi:MAG TPA: thiamine phosphate synthase [Candidatus Udaeobacter sp.]|nr:thiamine phosphate synthase [Methylomirabilota bacterium]HWN83340.1 thiamine phosphate synthase [Candidatus Udaeobacter sp.]
MRLPSPLYVILDRSVAGSRSLDDLLDLVLAGGGRLVQLREKTMPAVEMLPVARRLARRCREAGALFIVNDRADIAVAADAHGVHVGQDDMPAREARALLRPGMVLGVSTHDEDQAGAAVTAGADYVAVGSIFPTTSRVDFQLVGTDLIRRVRSEVPVPLVAIGGITADNAAEVIRAGADGVAVISAICANRNPEAATRTLLERLHAARGPRPAP